MKKISNPLLRYANKNYLVFERLRLFVCFVLFLYFLWPFQYYISNISTSIRIILVMTSSLTDTGVCFIISIISYRTFTSYHKIRARPLPYCYKLILFIFVIINGIICAILEMLSYGLTDKKFDIFDDIYYYSMYIWFLTESALLIVLFYFLIKIARIFGRIYSYQKARPAAIERKERKMRALYMRMIYLCFGLMIYVLLLIGSYIYFFISGDESTNNFWWIISHEWLGHMVLYGTFYSYLRIRTNDQFYTISYSAITPSNKLDRRATVTVHTDTKYYQSTGDDLDETEFDENHQGLDIRRDSNGESIIGINGTKKTLNLDQHISVDIDVASTITNNTQLMEEHYTNLKMQYNMMSYGVVPPIQQSGEQIKLPTNIQYDNFVI